MIVNDTLIRIVICGITGTTLMTLFSYALTFITGRNFKEPELLNTLLIRSHILRRGRENNILGWIIHYVVGFLFITMLEGSVDFFLRPTVFTYALAGLIFGVIGMVGWMITFAIASNPPGMNRTRFYVQIVVAHVVFGVGAYVGLLLLVKEPSPMTLCALVA